MTIDTLAYVKALEAAGLDRRHAEAQAEALIHYVLPDLVTKDDLTATKTDLERAMEEMKHEVQMTIEHSAHRQTTRMFGMLFGTVGLMNAVLFLLLRFVH